MYPATLSEGWGGQRITMDAHFAWYPQVILQISPLWLMRVLTSDTELTF